MAFVSVKLVNFENFQGFCEKNFVEINKMSNFAVAKAAGESLISSGVNPQMRLLSSTE